MIEVDDNRRPRDDAPGVWHHVMNRGLARRPAFENRKDIRFFLSRVARKVREGQIELHAYAVLTTHFHLLVRSPRGELSQAMMWIENQYVRWFNRTRDRDGSLFRGRFTSRVVDSISYWHTLVRYIDENPVVAGIARCSLEYPYCSAWHYARPVGPIWLARHVIEQEVLTVSDGEIRPGERYLRSFPSLRDDERWIVERRTSHGAPFHRAEDDFDDLLRSAPDRVRLRLKARARLADGVDPGAPIAAPAAVLDEIARERAQRPLWVLPTSTGRSVSAWEILAAGLLRSACTLTQRETAQRLGSGVARVVRAVELHAEWLEVHSDYGSMACRVLSASAQRSGCILHRRSSGSGTPGLAIPTR